MSGINEARAALALAEGAAAYIVETGRLHLGLAILDAREKGVAQKDIAELLGLTREQVRRLTVAAREADSPELREHVADQRDWLALDIWRSRVESIRRRRSAPSTSESADS